MPAALTRRARRSARGDDPRAGLSSEVACVDGDDCVAGRRAARRRRARHVHRRGIPPRQIISANAYLGAFPIAAALARGADIVITGRVVDSALALWPADPRVRLARAHDYDRAGRRHARRAPARVRRTGHRRHLHRLAQRAGAGRTLAFPIGECHADGTPRHHQARRHRRPRVGRHRGRAAAVRGERSGRLHRRPTYAATSASVQLEQDGPDRVRVSGARGRPATDTYKVCITYEDGWRAIAYQPIIGEEAAAKARAPGRRRCSRARGDCCAPATWRTSPRTAAS